MARPGRHPAALDLGDRFAHALANHRDPPLPYVGEGFAQTDVRPAWRPNANAAADVRTSSNIAAVSRPVLVFWRETR